MDASQVQTERVPRNSVALSTRPGGAAERRAGAHAKISSGQTFLSYPMKIMGLDVGDRRIGVATCDPLEIVASPREVVKRDGRELDVLERFVREEEIERVVVGMPYNSVGQIGP